VYIQFIRSPFAKYSSKDRSLIVAHAHAPTIRLSSPGVTYSSLQTRQWWKPSATGCPFLIKFSKLAKKLLQDRKVITGQLLK